MGQLADWFDKVNSSGPSSANMRAALVTYYIVTLMRMNPYFCLRLKTVKLNSGKTTVGVKCSSLVSIL